MRPLVEFDTVRVIAVAASSRELDGSGTVRRAPRIGDVGAVVHVLEKQDAVVLVVESVDQDGLTVWVAEFAPHELERVGPCTRQHCCMMMTRQVDFACEQHPDPADCPDSLVGYSPNCDEYGIRVHDGGSSWVVIDYCPWCGKQLANERAREVQPVRDNDDGGLSPAPR